MVELQSLTGNAMQAVANVEAEQAVLGVLMMHPAEAWEEVGELSPAAFFEPLHARLMEAMIEARAAGRSAEPTLLAPSFRADPALQALGGLRYLLDLVDRAPPVCSAAEFGRGVRDAALRRSLLETAGEVIDRVRIDHKSDAAVLAIDAERAFTTLASAGSTRDAWQTGGGVVRDAIAQAQARGGRDPVPDRLGGCGRPHRGLHGWRGGGDRRPAGNGQEHRGARHRQGERIAGPRRTRVQPGDGRGPPRAAGGL